VRHKTGIAVVAALLFFGAAQLAWPDEEPLPPEIWIVLAGMGTGIPPTEAQQKRLHDYADAHEHAPVDGITLGYVVAIVDTCRATGQKPPAAELAKIQKWTAGLQRRQAEMQKRDKQLIDDLKKEEAKARAEGRPSEAPKLDPNAKKVDPNAGTVTITVDSDVTDDNPKAHKTAKATTEFSATFPVRFQVTDTSKPNAPGDLTITWMLDGSRTGTDAMVRGGFKQHGEQKDPVSSAVADAGFPFECAAKSGGAMTQGTISVLKGAPRPWFKAIVSTNQHGATTATQHTNNPPPGHDSTHAGETVAVPSMPFSLDETAALDSPFVLPKEVPEQYRAMALDQLRKNMDPALVAAAKAANCTFAADLFRKQYPSQFKIPLTYSWEATLEKNGQTTTSHFKTTVELRFGPAPPEPELILEPLDVEPGPPYPSYEGWAPEGPKPGDDPNGIGNMIRFRVRTRDPNNPKGPPPARVTKATFTLTPKTVSQNHGACMNFPAAGGKNQKGSKPQFDLSFDDSQLSGGSLNEKVGHWENEGQTFLTKDDMGDSVVTIVCRDWGAYGSLKAVGTVNGKEYPAKFYKVEGSARDSVFLPLDDNNNMIADVWEKLYDVYSKNNPAGWDKETVPEGKKDADGDGYTFYEEYRGFVTGKPSDPKITRLDPRKKKLLYCIISDSLRDRLVAPIALFEKASGLLTYEVPNEKYLKETGGVPGARWSNFNTTGDTGLFADKPQCAVRIEEVPYQEAAWVNPDYTLAKEKVKHKDGSESLEVTRHFPNPARARPWRDFDQLENGVPAELYRVEICPESGMRMATGEATWQKKCATGDYDPTKQGEADMWTGAQRSLGLTPAMVVEMTSRHTQKAGNAVTDFTIIHELGHTVGMNHHHYDSPTEEIDGKDGRMLGDPACPMRYWHFAKPNWPLPWILGLWDPSKTALVGPSFEHFVTPDELRTPDWKFCSVAVGEGGDYVPCMKQMILHR
jgi:hypothetical protein